MNPTLTLSDEQIGSIGVCFDRWDGDRPQYTWTVDTTDGVFSDSDLRLGSRTTLQSGEALYALLDFLAAFAESVEHLMRTGMDGDNIGLFPQGMRDWAYAVGSDQFSMMAWDVAGEEN